MIFVNGKSRWDSIGKYSRFTLNVEDYQDFFKFYGFIHSIKNGVVEELTSRTRKFSFDDNAFELSITPESTDISNYTFVGSFTFSSFAYSSNISILEYSIKANNNLIAKIQLRKNLDKLVLRIVNYYDELENSFEDYPVEVINTELMDFNLIDSDNIKIYMFPTTFNEEDGGNSIVEIINNLKIVNGSSEYVFTDYVSQKIIDNPSVDLTIQYNATGFNLERTVNIIVNGFVASSDLNLQLEDENIALNYRIAFVKVYKKTLEFILTEDVFGMINFSKWKINFYEDGEEYILGYLNSGPLSQYSKPFYDLGIREDYKRIRAYTDSNTEVADGYSIYNDEVISNGDTSILLYNSERGDTYIDERNGTQITDKTFSVECVKTGSILEDKCSSIFQSPEVIINHLGGESDNYQWFDQKFQSYHSILNEIPEMRYRRVFRVKSLKINEKYSLIYFICTDPENKLDGYESPMEYDLFKSRMYGHFEMWSATYNHKTKELETYSQIVFEEVIPEDGNVITNNFMGITSPYCLCRDISDPFVLNNMQFEKLDTSVSFKIVYNDSEERLYAFWYSPTPREGDAPSEEEIRRWMLNIRSIRYAYSEDLGETWVYQNEEGNNLLVTIEQFINEQISQKIISSFDVECDGNRFVFAVTKGAYIDDSYDPYRLYQESAVFTFVLDSPINNNRERSVVKNLVPVAPYLKFGVNRNNQSFVNSVVTGRQFSSWGNYRNIRLMYSKENNCYWLSFVDAYSSLVQIEESEAPVNFKQGNSFIFCCRDGYNWNQFITPNFSLYVYRYWTPPEFLSRNNYDSVATDDGGFYRQPIEENFATGLQVDDLSVYHSDDNFLYLLAEVKNEKRLVFYRIPPSLVTSLMNFSSNIFTETSRALDTSSESTFSRARGFFITNEFNSRLYEDIEKFRFFNSAYAYDFANRSNVGYFQSPDPENFTNLLVDFGFSNPDIFRFENDILVFAAERADLQYARIHNLLDPLEDNSYWRMITSNNQALWMNIFGKSNLGMRYPMQFGLTSNQWLWNNMNGYYNNAFNHYHSNNALSYLRETLWADNNNGSTNTYILSNDDIPTNKIGINLGYINGRSLSRNLDEALTSKGRRAVQTFDSFSGFLDFPGIKFNVGFRSYIEVYSPPEGIGLCYIFNCNFADRFSSSSANFDLTWKNTFTDTLGSNALIPFELYYSSENKEKLIMDSDSFYEKFVQMFGEDEASFFINSSQEQRKDYVIEIFGVVRTRQNSVFNAQATESIPLGEGLGDVEISYIDKDKEFEVKLFVTIYKKFGGVKNVLSKKYYIPIDEIIIDAKKELTDSEGNPYSITDTLWSFAGPNSVNHRFMATYVRAGFPNFFDNEIPGIANGSHYQSENSNAKFIFEYCNIGRGDEESIFENRNVGLPIAYKKKNIYLNPFINLRAYGKRLIESDKYKFELKPFFNADNLNFIESSQGFQSPIITGETNINVEIVTRARLSSDAGEQPSTLPSMSKSLSSMSQVDTVCMRGLSIFDFEVSATRGTETLYSKKYSLFESIVFVRKNLLRNDSFVYDKNDYYITNEYVKNKNVVVVSLESSQTYSRKIKEVFEDYLLFDSIIEGLDQLYAVLFFSEDFYFQIPESVRVAGVEKIIIKALPDISTTRNRIINSFSAGLISINNLTINSGNIFNSRMYEVIEDYRVKIKQLDIVKSLGYDQLHEEYDVSYKLEQNGLDTKDNSIISNNRQNFLKEYSFVLTSLSNDDMYRFLAMKHELEKSGVISIFNKRNNADTSILRLTSGINIVAEKGKFNQDGTIQYIMSFSAEEAEALKEEIVIKTEDFELEIDESIEIFASADFEENWE